MHFPSILPSPHWSQLSRGWLPRATSQEPTAEAGIKISQGLQNKQHTHLFPLLSPGWLLPLLSFTRMELRTVSQLSLESLNIRNKSWKVHFSVQLQV